MMDGHRFEVNVESEKSPRDANTFCCFACTLVGISSERKTRDLLKKTLAREIWTSLPEMAKMPWSDKK